MEAVITKKPKKFLLTVFKKNSKGLNFSGWEYEPTDVTDQAKDQRSAVEKNYWVFIKKQDVLNKSLFKNWISFFITC